MSAQLQCEVCHKNIHDDGIQLHRVNETGVEGIWRCQYHITDEQRKSIDPFVAEICRVIEQDNIDKSQ